MATQTIILPYHRASPVYIPRRDMVFARSDTLALRVSVVQSDDVAAQLLLLTGGIGGPALRMTIRRPGIGFMPDYGALSRSALLTVINGTIAGAGTFLLSLPPGGMSDWPTRCYFEIQLNNPSQGTSTILAHGMLHISGGSSITYGEIPLTTDDDVPVLNDDSVPLDVV